MDVFCTIRSLERDDFFIQICTLWAEKIAGRPLAKDERAFFEFPIPLKEVRM